MPRGDTHIHVPLRTCSQSSRYGANLSVCRQEKANKLWYIYMTEYYPDSKGRKLSGGSGCNLSTLQGKSKANSVVCYMDEPGGHCVT